MGSRCCSRHYQNCDLRKDFDKAKFGEDKQRLALARRPPNVIKELERLRLLTWTLACHCPPVAEMRSKYVLDLKRICEHVPDNGQHLCGIVRERSHLETGLASIRESQKSIEEAVAVKV